MQASIAKRFSIAACAAVVLALAVPASATDFSQTRTFSSDSLTLTNLIGEVHVTGHSGSDFEVTVRVRGADATSDNVRLESGADHLKVVLPKSKRYVYPALDSRHEINFRQDGDDSWLGALLGRSQFKVSDSGSGMEVWADIEVRVPADGELRLRQGIGTIRAEDVAGDLDLDSHHGDVTVTAIDGEVRVDTGSGDVTIAEAEGGVNVDTGSGDVSVTQSRGDAVVIDTGSGGVTLTGVASSGDVSVDTGSGDVKLSDVSGAEINIDTGSGDVDASDVRADSALIDTGSGYVTLSLTQMGRGRFEIDTGSGGIKLGLPPTASCRVQAESNSGITVDIAGIQPVRRDADEVTFTIGGGDAWVSLDSGSGRIRIVEAN